MRTGLLFALVAGMAFASPVFANPTSVGHANSNNCDTLSIPLAVDELGTVFPPANVNDPNFDMRPDEQISAVAVPTDLIACEASDTAAPNVMLSITNLTGRFFSNLWYVADPGDLSTGLGGTTLSNFDGIAGPFIAAPGGLTFKIDAVGVNRPLVGESILVDGIFAPGEVWDIVIDDFLSFFNTPASFMSSVGVAGNSGGFPGKPSSTGSIIAIERVGTPEASAASLLLLGLLGLARLRR